MSARFGRNQKRRMREQLAAEQVRAAGVEQQLVLSRHSANAHAAEARAATDFLRRVVEEVGPHALAAGDPILYDHELRRGEVSFCKFPYRPPCVTPYNANFVMSATIDMRHQIMELLQVSAIRDHFADQMHCHVKLAGKEAGYTISRSALRDSGVEYIERIVAKEIARQLIAQIRGGA